MVKALAYLLLPIVSLAGDTQSLLDLARSAPAEFAADSLIRIAALPQIPKAKQLELLQQAFEYGGMAQHPYKLQSAVTGMGGSAAFLNRANLQGLDGMTLRLRAIEAIIPLDPKEAWERFDQLPPLQLPALGCAQNQGYDVSLYYEVLGRVAGQHSIDRYLAALTSPAQVGPAARMLSRLGVGNDAFRSAATAFAGALPRVGSDDRSFTMATTAGGDVLALVEACRNRGVPGVMVVDAYRQYLVSHLAGERCADNAQIQNNSANVGTGIANEPLADQRSADAVRLFNEKIREAPVKPIERYETYASKTEGTASTAGACDDAACLAVREAYRHLLFNSIGVAYSADERGKQEWRDQLPGLLEKLDQWKDASSRDRVAAFAAKCSFYSELAGVAVMPADRDAIYRAMVEFVRRSDLRSENRMEWFLPLNALIGRAAMYPAGYGQLIDELAKSSDPVIALYAQLEMAAPRAPGLITLLL
uniref:Uncharacterized protein n=1 Tax=Solibacter usitatus (strain Ellin6076) TaxID=234267 RepID=Q020U8_SOLUE